MFDVTSDDGSTVTVAGVLPCDPDRAFAAFVEPALLGAWWQTEATTDPTVGGSYHMHWPGPGWHLRGEYRRVDPPRLLAFGWSWDHDDVEAEVTIGFDPHDDGTSVEIRHTYTTDGDRDAYVDGWLHFLPRIAEVV